MRLFFAGFVSLACAFLGTNLQAQDWANLEVKIIFDGDTIPKMEVINMGKDAACQATKTTENIIVNPENKGIQNAFLWVDFKKSGLDVKKDVHKDVAGMPAVDPVIDNKDCVFVPHAMVMRAGNKLVVTNSDNTGHNANLSAQKNKSENKSIPSMGKVVFNMIEAESVVSTIDCGSHPWMKTRVLVMDHPYAAVSDANGMIKMDKVPAKKLTFKLFHENQNKMEDIEVNGKPAKWPKGYGELDLKAGDNKFEIKIKAAQLTK